MLAALAADPAPPAWQGVWQGTIGPYPVQMCFEQRDWGDLGAYYYRSRAALIALDRDEAGHWREGKDGPKLRVASAGPDRLAGSWSDKDRSLPISLVRAAPLADDDDERPCGSLAFHRPRLGKVSWQRTPARIGRLAYERIRLVPGKGFTTVNVDTFALAAATPAAAAINARVAQQLKTEDWFDCLRGAAAMQGTDGDYDDSYTPKAVRGPFLSVTHNLGGSCGGAHPYWDIEPLTFDLGTGGLVELARWVSPRGMVPSKESDGAITFQPSPALKRLLRARWPKGGDDCEAEVFDYAFGWRIGLTAGGLGFTPNLPHVAQGCAEELSLSFAELSPFLSAEGQAGRKAIGSR